MNKKVLSAMTGAIALALGVGLNTQNALNDYGISENPLSKFVWAQTNTDGNETDDDRDNTGDVFQKPKFYDCKVAFTGDVDDAFEAAESLGIELGSATAGDGASVIVAKEARIECKYGGNNKCIYRDCGTFMEMLLNAM